MPSSADWREIRLSECCEIVSGSTPRRDRPEYWDGDIPWVTPKDLSALDSVYIADAPEKITGVGYQSCSTTMLPRGSVLYSSRAPIGLVAIAGRDMCTNQGFKSLVPSTTVDSGYLYWAMRRVTPKISAQGTGTTFKEVSKEVMGKVRIPVPTTGDGTPDLNEQRRIAAILNQADVLRRKRREAIQMTEELLHSAYMYRVGPGNANYRDWEPAPIASLAMQQRGSIRSGPFGSALKHSEFVDLGIAVLGIDNAVQNRFAWGQRRYITGEKYSGLERYRVYPRDVIVTIMGTTGRSAVVPDDIPEAITTKHLAAITLDEHRALPEYVSQAIHRDPHLVHQVSLRNRGAIMAGLNLGLIKELLLRVPPLELQQRFQEEVTTIREFEYAHRQAAHVADNLFNALVQRAFRGDL